MQQFKNIRVLGTLLYSALGFFHMVKRWLSHSQLHSKAGRRGLLASFSLYLKKKVFPRSPRRLLLRSHRSELDHMLPLNQSLIKENEIIPYDWLWRIMVPVLGLSFPEYIGFLYLKEKNQDSMSKGEVGNSWWAGNQQCVIASVWVWAGGSPEAKSLWQEEPQGLKTGLWGWRRASMESVVCSQTGGLIRDHYAGFWAN